MKKYRHIPTGKVVVQAASGYVADNAPQLNSSFVPTWVIENSKDWEEVKDKPEWTILSFKNTQLKPTGILSLLPDGKYGVHSWVYTLDHLLNNTTFNSIHSVRRESDDEVFTIGDKYINGSGEFTIKSFRIEGTTVIISAKEWGCSHLKIIQKVKPKEWEITAFITEKAICHVSKNEVKLPFGIYSVDEYLTGRTKLAKTPLYAHGNPIPIYSVKRLSDGIEFKIGDKVRDDASNSPDRKKVRTIQKISLQENGLLVLWVGDMYPVFIKDAIKVKLEKLFTTEDGVDIYEGDPYAFVIRKTKDDEWGKDFELREQNYALPQHVIQDREYPGRYFNFSNKKKAEEYILMNKPCLSLADLESLSENKEGCFTEVLIKYARELVKSKLK